MSKMPRCRFCYAPNANPYKYECCRYCDFCSSYLPYENGEVKGWTYVEGDFCCPECSVEMAEEAKKSEDDSEKSDSE